MEGPKATVAILTLNGERFLDEVLAACAAQRAPFPFEILVVDSGSTDSTLEIVGRHRDARLHRIPNREFGHGRTRNLAAGLARGEIVVFLTQDATPVGTDWLARLTAPFDGDPGLAGVYARQTPRPGCGPAASREITEVFRDPPAGFFSNVCSAVRRSALDRLPFRDVDYAEDQAFAADAARAGLRTAYAATAEVRHSHDLRLGEYFRRMYDEARGMRGVGRRPRTDLLWLAGATVRGTVLDWRFLASAPDYTTGERLRWAMKVPAYNLGRRAAIWSAARSLPEPVTRFLSLEARRRLVPAR